MNCEPWARVVFSHVSKSALLYSSKAVIFKDDHHCITPSGMLDLIKNDRRLLPDSLHHRFDVSGHLFHSCSGKYLFASETDYFEPSEETPAQVKRVDIFEPSLSIDSWWVKKGRTLADVSPTGRYLVLGVRDGFSVVNFKEEMSLYDTISNETIDLHLPEPLDYLESKFHFSKHETRLTAFLLGRSAINVLIWDCLAIAPRLTSHAKWSPNFYTGPRQIHVHKAATSAVMVTGTRSIQRIGLGDSIEFLDAEEVIDDYPHRLSAISMINSSWALVSYGRKGGKVQILDLMSSDAPARSFELEWSQSEIAEILDLSTSLPQTLSPDLDVLVINAEVFDMANKVNKPFVSTLAPFTIEGLPALLKSHRYPISSWGLQCYISPCNSFVVYVGRGDQWGNTSRYSPAIDLFQIDLEKRTSARLELNLPDELCSPHASFHPSLPLMAISYALPTVTGFDNIPSLHLAIFDLKTLEAVELGVPGGQLKNAIAM